MAQRLTRASDGASHVPVAWFPDATRILFIESRDDTDTLWVFSRSDGKATRFSTAQSRALPMSVTLSPDARWIAYTSSGELFVQPFPATGAVYPVAAPSSFPRWSANGRELLHQVRGEIYSIGITTEPGFRFDRPVPLAAEVSTVLALTAGGYDVLRDGGFVAAATTAGIDSGNRQIHIVLNWTEELKRLVHRHADASQDHSASSSRDRVAALPSRLVASEVEFEDRKSLRRQLVTYPLSPWHLL